jgi:hypothetical protein
MEKKSPDFFRDGMARFSTETLCKTLDFAINSVTPATVVHFPSLGQKPLLYLTPLGLISSLSITVTVKTNHCQIIPNYYARNGFRQLLLVRRQFSLLTVWKPSMNLRCRARQICMITTIPFYGDLIMLGSLILS